MSCFCCFAFFTQDSDDGDDYADEAFWSDDDDDKTTHVPTPSPKKRVLPKKRAPPSRKPTPVCPLTFGQKVNVIPTLSKKDQEPRLRGYVWHIDRHRPSENKVVTTVAVRFLDGSLRTGIPLENVSAGVPKSAGKAARLQYDLSWKEGDEVCVVTGKKSASVNGRVVKRHDDTWIPTFDIEVTTKSRVGGRDTGPKVMRRVVASLLKQPTSSRNKQNQNQNQKGKVKAKSKNGLAHAATVRRGHNLAHAETLKHDATTAGATTPSNGDAILQVGQAVTGLPDANPNCYEHTVFCANCPSCEGHSSCSWSSTWWHVGVW